MILTQTIKDAINGEFNNWVEHQYANRSAEERQKSAQFYTPPEITFALLEKFESVEDKDILDPASGCGGLLAACIIAGADPKRVYGVEIDPDIVKISKERLAALGVPPENIQLANALSPSSYDFSEENQITVQRSYLKHVFCEEALKLPQGEGWKAIVPKIEKALTLIDEPTITLRQIIALRYKLFELLEKVDETEYDMALLFPKYDPTEKERVQRVKDMAKKPEKFFLKEHKNCDKINNEQ